MELSRISRNVAWLTLDKCVKILIGITVGIWVARYLGPEAYGELSFAIVFCSIFVVFSDLGFAPIMIRDVVRKPDVVPAYMGTIFLIKMVGAILAVFFMVFSSRLMSLENLNKAAVLIIGASYIFKSIDVIDFYYQSIVRSKYVILARNLALLISSAFKIALIILEADLIYFIWVIFIEALLASSFIFLIYLKESGVFVWEVSLSVAKTMIKGGWPIALSGFLIMVHMRIDQLMIGAMLDKIDLGVFSVAVNLSEYWLFFPSILVGSLTPYFVQLRESNTEMYGIRMKQFFSLMFWMGVLVGITVTLFGKQIILLLYGEPFIRAYEPLTVNIWAGIFISQGLARGIWLINEDLQIYRLYNNLIAVALNILLNLFLIPRFGIVGAAIATLLTQGLATWVFSLIWRPLRSSTLDMIRAVNPKNLVAFMVR